MNILLTYSSKTGNTEKVAKAIYEILPEDSTISSIEEEPDFEDFDLILIGFWVDRGLPNANAKKFMENIKGKKIGIFGTLGAYPDSQHAMDTIKRTKEILEPSNEVVAEFLCQGKIDPKLTERFKTLPLDHPHAMNEERRKRHEEAKKHPNAKDLIQAQNIFKNLIINLEGGNVYETRSKSI